MNIELQAGMRVRAIMPYTAWDQQKGTIVDGYSPSYVWVLFDHSIEGKSKWLVLQSLLEPILLSPEEEAIWQEKNHQARLKEEDDKRRLEHAMKYL